MAFNLKKVLRALLFSSSQALSIKDVQDIFARFHEQAPPATEADGEGEVSLLAVPARESEPGETPTPGDAAAEIAETAGQPADDVAFETPAIEAPETPVEREPDPEPDPEAPSLKPAELVSARFEQSEQAAQSTAEPESIATGAPVPQPQEASEVAATAPEDTDAELYQDVPSLITAAQIREAMDGIAAELKAANDIYILVEGPSGYRLMTHPRFARWIRIMRDEPPPVKLTQSALETLAVVAYRQPATRSEIEAIRGVSAEAGLNKLIERELVYITGRADLPGRPLQYSTTDKFLEFVGVKSLVELPASDVLSPRQIDAWLQNATKVTPPSDAEMGLPLEEGEGESPNLANVSITHSTAPFEITGETTTTGAPPEAQAAPPDDSPPAAPVEPDNPEAPEKNENE